jgi:WD40 repeat protein
MLAMGDSGGTVIVHDPSRRAKVGRLSVESDPVLGLAWEPEGGGLLVAGQKGEVRRWGPRPGGEEGDARVVFEFGNNLTLWRTGTWGPGARKLASTKWKKQIVIHDAGSGTLERELTDHEQDLLTVAWHSDGRRLAAIDG